MKKGYHLFVSVRSLRFLKKKNLFFEPENMVEKNDPDEVKNPADRSAESNPKNAEDKVEDIAVFDRTKNTINRPDNINDGQAE